MRKKLLSAFSIFILPALLVCLFMRAGRVEEFSSNPLEDLAVPRSTSVPKLVASQITGGSLSCPTSESLTYESCLLYQGALAIWQVMGLPDVCPKVVDHSTPLLVPHAAKLTAEDVVRAPTVSCFSYIYAAQVANLVPTL